MSAAVDVALVTCRALPGLSVDDRLLADALRARGADVGAVVWDDPAADWAACRLAVIRSTWDYTGRAAAYALWAEHAARRTVLANPATTVVRNVDKRYLRDLSHAGVRVVETEWFEPGSPADLPHVLERRGWDRAVVKPAVSAGARDTAVVEARDVAPGEALLADILASGRVVLVQPFLDAVATEGEFSVVCVDGEPEHAVLKRPARGDWRVQPQHGGSVARVPLTDTLATAARDALAGWATITGDQTPPLYARVDLVVDRPGGLVELELIEPALFLGLSRSTTARLADAILARLG